MYSNDVNNVMEEEEAHQGLTGGHVGADATARNQSLAGLWWPTLRMSKNYYLPVMHVNELANKVYRSLKGVAAKLGNSL